MYLSTSIFVDLSNIFYGAQDSVPRLSSLPIIRLKYDNLMKLALAGHPLDQAVVVTTERVGNVAALDAAEKAGFHLLRSEPGAFTGRKQNVDERLQLEMYKAAAMRPPAQAVLLTGDGHRGRDADGGFIPALRALATQGTRVELLAWRRCCSAALEAAVLEVGGIVNYLDTFLSAVTFEQAGRRAEPLNLRRRRHLPEAA